MYLRYVDDVFAVFDNDDKCKSFLNVYLGKVYQYSKIINKN